MIHLPRCPRVAPGVSIAKRAIWEPVCLALGKNAKLQSENRPRVRAKAVRNDVSFPSPQELLRPASWLALLSRTFPFELAPTSRPQSASNMTTWINSQFPRPDFHRQVQRYYGLQDTEIPPNAEKTDCGRRPTLEPEIPSAQSPHTAHQAGEFMGGVKVTIDRACRRREPSLATVVKSCTTEIRQGGLCTPAQLATCRSTGAAVT